MYKESEFLMAWITPAVVTVGSTMSSSQWNAQARDNLNLTAPGIATTAGDVFYGSASHTLARLGIGTKYQILRVNSGATALEWSKAPPCGYIYNVTGGQTINTTDTVITFDTTEVNNDSMANLGSHNERLTFNTTGWYWVSGQVITAAATHPMLLEIVQYNSSDAVVRTVFSTETPEDGSTNITTAEGSNWVQVVNTGDYVKLIAKCYIAAATVSTSGSRTAAKLSAILVRA